MKITEVKDLNIEGIKIIKLQRFSDERGYFTEIFKESDFLNNEQLGFFEKETKFPQCNESFSKKGTIRGLHLQWNPFQGKLIRVIHGKMIDFALDVRKKSPTLGKIIGHEMNSDSEKDSGEWLWIPPGFAHGFLALQDTTIEYFCTGEYSPGCEMGISPFSKDIDWSICDSDIKKTFDSISQGESIISDKDLNGISMNEWLSNTNSEQF